ncbi:hypothetical protein GNZ12_31895 [Paraburkholderia sp. 1N]|uniref:Uncharacterized protein n=1 Tax=Paraburkholderia solitsugae TaxID=2675748 RepID=A0ABX2BVW8_9BURK|nr:hypothetical protein [Paraburkholderia solitsugae]NPT44128.1 hypothetical protein [Paraburkholderia solitsugae]NPT45839.1 hypothetical protein [Paraburkholderia solitsugae]
MGESLPKLHSTIISRYVTAKQAAAGWFRQGVKATARTSAQGELDDAAKNEDEKRGGDGHVQRIAHSSPGTSVAVFLS